MRLHGLQYLRAIAALAVVYSHSTLQVPAYQTQLPHAGSFGVDIFFVISGFIMVYIARPDDTARRFLIQRIRRVVPLYWFFTLLMAAILLLAPAVFKRTVFDATVLWQSLLFIPHFSLTDPLMLWPLVAPGWSLNYEMYFYLVFALSLLLPKPYRILTISLVITTIFMLSQLLGSTTAAGLFFGDAIVFEFIIGMLVAALWLRGYRTGHAAGIVCLLVGTLWLLLPLTETLPRLWHFGVGATLIVVGTLNISVPLNRTGVLLGDASYALYLSHLFVLGVWRKLVPPMLGEGPVAAWLFALSSLVVCTVVSVLVYRWIDNGLLRISAWRFSQRARE